ncbi:hypothetical protein BABINDRAFT_162925 [Babjeviella inositovora NRRL Y-12698]|uniref:Enhancer of mRNA-decapping protein 1 n=1 Tax=Babjeviella inositovora NRRL Y-12698 TaxID=984486 RepID=A0A1E3QKU0_9ASCO|nr:uncharacterized protein BABINDRAFT_162925 [Babjeviella inositovora NRRL Y-12698]ODQ78270.1 hypothetical protein BABINDRAFT_162925 [Babjeviella inositovora NRRL Y-12698]
MSETPQPKNNTSPRSNRSSKKSSPAPDTNGKQSKTAIQRSNKVAVSTREKVVSGQTSSPKEKAPGSQSSKKTSRSSKDRAAKSSQKDSSANPPKAYKAQEQTLPDGSAPNFGGSGATTKPKRMSTNPNVISDAVLLNSEKPNVASTTKKELKNRATFPKNQGGNSPKRVETQLLPNGQKVDFGNNGPSEKILAKSKGNSKPLVAVAVEDMGKYAGSSFHVSPAALDLPKPSFKKVSGSDASPVAALLSSGNAPQNLPHSVHPGVVSSPMAYANMPLHMHPAYANYTPYAPPPMMPVQAYPVVPPYGYQHFAPVPPHSPYQNIPHAQHPTGQKMSFNDLIASSSNSRH